MKELCNVNFIELGNKKYPCATSFVMDLIGGKWKTVILCQLKNREVRFSELKKELSFITESTLNLQLKQLEKNGLIVKVVIGNKPPLKVIYSLSSFGESFIPILEQINLFGKEIINMNKSLPK